MIWSMTTLSVPSSSGRTLQRRPRLEELRRGEAFSSLFIGKDSSTTSKASNCRWIVSFSSLFIGKDSSTGPAATSPRSSTPFQFPLHREGLFNWTGVQRWPAPGSLFQFPLHREGLFNDGHNTEGASWARLSVPSSSGRTLQPAQTPEPEQAAIPFSSLFIGKDSSTLGGRTQHVWQLAFQFPLHREGLFNRGRKISL